MTPDEVTQLKAEVRHFTVDSIAGSGQFIHEEQPDVVVTAVTKLDEEAISR